MELLTADSAALVGGGVRRADDTKVSESVTDTTFKTDTCKEVLWPTEEMRWC